MKRVNEFAFYFAVVFIIAVATYTVAGFLTNAVAVAIVN